MPVFERVSETRFEGPLATIDRLSERIVEIRMKPGVEIDGRGMKAIEACTRTLTEGAPIAQLVDRRTSYSLSYGAQRVLAADETLAAVAYLIDNSVSQVVVDFARETYLKGVAIETFTRRDRAIAWLQEVLMHVEVS